MNDPELTKAVAEFIAAFEVVFAHDWDYTKFGCAHIKEGATFLNPEEDEYEDWWARGILLERYRSLRALMKQRKIELQFSDELRHVMTVFRHANTPPPQPTTQPTTQEKRWRFWR